MSRLSPRCSPGWSASCRPACCRWCRPIWSISPAPRSSGWRTPSPRRGCGARRIAAALLFVAGFSTVFVSLGAAASSVGTGLRHLQALLAGRFDAFNAATGSICRPSRSLQHDRRHRHHRDGSALPGHHADPPAAPGGAARDAEAGRAVGRLCDGARVRARLDALHRPDPGRDPRGRRVEGDGRARAPACWRSIRSGSACRSSSRPSRSSRSPRSSPASATISCISSG